MMSLSSARAPSALVAPLPSLRSAPRALSRASAGPQSSNASQVLDRASSKARTPRGEGTASSKKAQDARAFRRSLNKSGRYTKKILNDPESLALMEEHGVGYSRRGLVARMRASSHEWQQGAVTVVLAEAYGFCWGVERAVQMAYEARTRFPDRRLHITNEIIHNPVVNERLGGMGVHFIATDAATGQKDFSGVQAGDVVLLPAFGASVEEMRLLHERGAELVDTTCPWVSKVWNAVDNQARHGHTSVIHGKWEHEETLATASFAGSYVVVKDLKQARWLSDFMTNGGDRDAFFAEFANAHSAGFDPDKDLECIGMANQTTMLKGETQEIGRLLEDTQLRRFGAQQLAQHFMIMDTICDATQERQDAMFKLGERQKDPAAALDMMLVVGGFNSSNTSHLQEIGEINGVPSFWVDSAARIDVENNAIAHKMAHGELVVTRDWLTPGKPVRVGVTSGASTPDRSVERVLDCIFKIYDPAFQGVAALEHDATSDHPSEEE